MTQLREIEGVGESKSGKYGEAVLNIVALGGPGSVPAANTDGTEAVPPETAKTDGAEAVPPENGKHATRR